MEEEKKLTEGIVAGKDDYHPFQDAGFCSKIFYIWMLPIYRLGLRKNNLTENDLLPPLKAHNAHDLGKKLETSWKYEVKTQKNPSLWRALWRVHWEDFIFTGLLWIILETFIKASQPLCMSKFLDYYRPDSLMTFSEAYVYAGLLILIQFLQVTLSHYYFMNTLQLALKIRVSISSLVYRKALKLSKSSLAEITIGQMVNLLSNDISRFDSATIQFHSLWYSPIQALIVMYLCYIYLGPTAMTGIILLVLFIPFQMWMARKTSIFRQRTAMKTDERIRLMNEIISAIQMIKMYAWEKSFTKLVELSRRKEIDQLRNSSYIKATIGALYQFLNRCAVYLCLLIFVLIGNIPTAQYVYTLITFYNLLQYTITIQFPQSMTLFAEVIISMKRLHRFLMHDEVQTENFYRFDALPTHDTILEKQKDSALNDDIRVCINQAFVKWIKTRPENTLYDINLVLHFNELVAIVGPVGSGKTTLLHVILKELTLDKGFVSVNGTISYAAQEPWIFVGSIRHNITFGEAFDHKKYREVIRVCALETDFDLLPFGDQTIAGERGVTLSGGQKARINLARAIYKDADIYLLDDPLSAVDAQVGRHIFDDCILSYLKNKAVILVTHQLQYLHNIEKIYLLEAGRVQVSGTYDELQKAGKSCTKLLNYSEAEEKEECTEKIETDKKVSINEKENNAPKLQQEKRAIGNISWDVYKSYIFAGGHWCKILALLFGFTLSRTATSLTDYFQSFWVNLEQERVKPMKENLKTATVLNSTSANDNDPEKETSFWNTFLSEQNCLYIYTVLIFLTVTLTLLRSFVFYRFTIKASLRLHNNMFNKIVYATMKFFHSNPSGRILNRFSSDMGSIDEELPLILLETIQIASLVGATLIVIGTLNPWMFLPSVIMFIIFYFLRRIYLKTSRDVKRVEGTTRSPIYSHLNASLQGLTTIRAFGAQDNLQQRFDNFQNINGSVWFTFVCCARSFGLWMDLHCVAYVGMVMISFLFLRSEVFGGNVGLAITQALTMAGLFQYGMRQWSELENRMTCVERVKEYADVIPEVDQGFNEPPQTWPQKGEIRFEEICLKYDDNEPYVLKGLTFRIQSKENVGIVGRTGAGKSSIIAALFRLAMTDGKIVIDDIDTKSISLRKLRSSISIIPQEPVLFSGTLRKNLDPFDIYSDEALWNSLEEVKLKETVSELPQGLETRMSEGGSNFSLGQRQLICLARAIVRNNKILILDEATANVDPHTDALIQSTIRQRFSECTVLTIAHRLHTIMDSDKVLVIDAGKLVEFGHPYQLLEKDTMFYRLVKQTGKTTMDHLVEIAKNSYEEFKLKQQ